MVHTTDRDYTRLRRAIGHAPLALAAWTAIDLRNGVLR